MRRTQMPLFAPETEWVAPHELKDLSGIKEVAIDLETNDPELMTLGSGNVIGRGHIAGVAVAVEGWKGYFPIGKMAFLPLKRPQTIYGTPKRYHTVPRQSVSS